jgi:Lon protease-like protein
MYELALFPLFTVLFPGMPLHLHIFEPRYRLMIQRCLEANQPFGVVLIRKGEEAMGPLAEPYITGCTARIARTERLKDGSINLTVLGEERFRILELQYKEPYLLGKVETWMLEHPHTLHLLRKLPPLRQHITTYLRLITPLIGDEMDVASLQLPEDPLMLVYLAASLLQLPPNEKQPLLEAETANQLVSDVLRLYGREICVLPRLVKISQEDSSRAAEMN